MNLLKLNIPAFLVELFYDLLDCFRSQQHLRLELFE